MNATIDETIERVEQLYTTLTGKRPPQVNGPGALIPPEIDAGVHVHAQLGRMISAIEQLVPATTSGPTTSGPTATSGPTITPTITSGTTIWMPHAIAWTEDDDLVIALDIPGVEREQVQIRVESRAIVVNGQRRTPWSQQPRSINGCDAPLGAFARVFPLAVPMSPDRVAARLDGGVLTLRVQGAARAEQTQISIKS